MLKFLLGLSPKILMLVFGLGGLASGGAMAAAGFKIWNDWIDNPAIVRREEAICLLRVESAAANATQREQYRQYSAGRQSAEEFIRQQLEADAEWQARIEEVESENQAYRRRLAEEGRTCRITRDDIDFLTGVSNDRATGR